MKNDTILQSTINPPVSTVTSITHIVPTRRNRSNKIETTDEIEKVSKFWTSHTETSLENESFKSSFTMTG